MSCKLSDKCDNVFACNVLRPEVELLGCSFYKPKKPMTNEEYIHSLNTEQLAKWLRGIYWHCHEIDCKHCNYPWRCMEKGDIVKWLKQPHTDKE